MLEEDIDMNLFGNNYNSGLPDTHMTARIEQTGGPNRILVVQRWDNTTEVQHFSCICERREIEGILSSFGGRSAFKEIKED